MVALAAHAFVTGFSYNRAKQLVGKVTTHLKGICDSNMLPEVQSRIIGLILTSAVDVKRCTRWRASALASSLTTLHLDGFFLGHNRNSASIDCCCKRLQTGFTKGGGVGAIGGSFEAGR